MTVEMTLYVKFNREVSDKDYIVPGGYQMVMNGKDVHFDFCQSAFSVSEYDKKVGVFHLSDPDYVEFPDFRNVATEDFTKVTKIDDCYLYLGEPGESDLEVISIEHIAFDVFFETSPPPPTMVVSKKVLEAYNKTLQDQRGGEYDGNKELLVVHRPNTGWYTGCVKRGSEWEKVFNTTASMLFTAIQSYTNKGYALTACLDNEQAETFLHNNIK